MLSYAYCTRPYANFNKLLNFFYLPHRKGLISHAFGYHAFEQSRKYSARLNLSLKDVMSESWLSIGDYRVYPWSIAGVETSVVVKNENLNICFDMGYACRHSVKCKHVFISHGHMDHVSAVPQHATKRDLYSMKPAEYYVPPHLVDSLKSIAEGYHVVAESPNILTKLNIIPCNIGDCIQLPGDYVMRPFPTVHRVYSQGYLLYKQTKKLKAEYVGLKSSEVATKYRKGVEIHDKIEIPEVAYTGDTTFDIFLSPASPDLLKVRLLIMEATYIEPGEDKQGRCQVTKSRERGHIHLCELIEHAQLFKDVGAILLIHFSDKYSTGFIKDTVKNLLPECLQEKVYLATLAKETL